MNAHRLAVCWKRNRTVAHRLRSNFKSRFFLEETKVATISFDRIGSLVARRTSVNEVTPIEKLRFVRWERAMESPVTWLNKWKDFQSFSHVFHHWKKHVRLLFFLSLLIISINSYADDQESRVTLPTRIWIMMIETIFSHPDRENHQINV